MNKEQLEKLVSKMIKIVRADTGGSPLYADMLLSMLPNSEHKVNMAYWCYKADRDDFESMLELMKLSNTDLIFDYAELVEPHREDLKRYLSE